jgi:hypothetical protein
LAPAGFQGARPSGFVIDSDVCTMPKGILTEDE